MLESLYRVRAARSISRPPRSSRGRSSATNGFQFDYEHLDSDELWRTGRAVGAVIDGRLYLILLDAARSHYYDDALPDFEAMANSAHPPLDPAAARLDRARSAASATAVGRPATDGDGRHVDVRRGRGRRRRSGAAARASAGPGLGGGSGVGGCRVVGGCSGMAGSCCMNCSLAQQRLRPTLVARARRLAPRRILAIGRAPSASARAWRNW